MDLVVYGIADRLAILALSATLAGFGQQVQWGTVARDASVVRPKSFPQGGFSDSIKNCTLSKSFLGSTIQMALACELCGKKPSFGNIISHAHNVRRRRWNPNLRRVKAVIGGVRKHMRVCTACIRAGRVKKAA